MGFLLILRRIVRGIDEQAQVVTHRTNDGLPNVAFVFHLGKKLEVEAVHDPCIFIKFALKLPGRPSGVPEKAGKLNIRVFATQGLGLFQVDSKIQLEGGGVIQPLPCGHDQFIPFDGTALENGYVGKVDNLELFVQIAEFFSGRPVQDYTQGAMFFRMRRQKHDGLGKIGIPQARVREKNTARKAGSGLKSLS